MDLITKDRVIRDGCVAVLYSPGFGAGWSTWDHGDYGSALIFDPMLVDCVEKQDWDKMATYVAMKYPNLYTGGMHDLTIAWVPVGTLFKITEYDGSESIEFKESYGWIVA